MDDLACQVDGTIRKLLSGLIGVLNCPFDPITEAELLGQADRDVTSRQGILLSFKEVYKVSCIVGIQFGLDLGFQPETFPKVRASPSSVWGIGLHIPRGGGGRLHRTRRLHRRFRHTLNLAVTNR